MKNVAILGSTGSIGVNALKVIDAFPDKFNVVGLSAYSNIGLLQEQIRKFKPSLVTVVNPKSAQELNKKVGSKNLKVLSAIEGLNIIAKHRKVDIVIIAISGATAL